MTWKCADPEGVTTDSSSSQDDVGSDVANDVSLGPPRQAHRTAISVAGHLLFLLANVGCTVESVVGTLEVVAAAVASVVTLVVCAVPAVLSREACGTAWISVNLASSCSKTKLPKPRDRFMVTMVDVRAWYVESYE